MKIDYVSTGLDIGGAERNLMRLSAGLGARGHQVRVISLTGMGAIARQLEGLGIATSALNITPASVVPGLVRLSRWLRQGKADLIQTWMYHANLFGSLANQFACGAPVIWGVRQSNLHRVYSKRSTRLVRIAGRKRFKQVKSIVCCAESVRKVHEALGYDAGKMVVIPNGVDVNEFRPSGDARQRLKELLGIKGGNVRLVGLIGRFDAQKDHKNFLRAARLFADTEMNVHLVLCGDDIDWENGTLVNWVDLYYGRQGIHLLGLRMDIPQIIAGLDLLVSSASYGEGFPNVIVEAMACQVPVVGTDIGETAEIIGDEGWVVERENPEALAAAMLDACHVDAQKKLDLVIRGRARMERDFSVEQMCSRYEDLYTRIFKEA